ncbi:MAG: ribonuclease HII, partial [Streptomycetales bacterium]
VPGLADSKLLAPPVREEVYAEVVDRALAWSVVVIPAADVDRDGLHVSNVAGMRRALARLAVPPAYVLTDGFPVRGVPAPALAVPKGDRVTACIAAASVIAKVTRDRIMAELHDVYPAYGFAAHKGYVTPGHQQALERHGPSPAHRSSYVNVARVRFRPAVPATEQETEQQTEQETEQETEQAAQGSVRHNGQVAGYVCVGSV